MAGFKNTGGKRGFKGAPRGSFGGGFGGGKKFGGPKKFGSKPFKKFDRDDREQVMHAAVCSTCKKPCQVPFPPSADKPVYCRDCFAGRAALGGDRSFHKERKFPLAAGRTPQPAPKYESGEGHSLKKQVDAMNIKLDRLIEVVEAFLSRNQ
ncbi:MAG: CxxC-x17-CxxC domain-containing protein [Patescibacteria group bacterium]